MAFTQADVDAIKTAIASGEHEITYGDGRRIQYRSVAELQSALQLAQNEVAAAAGTTKKRTVRFQTSKGV